MPEAAVWDSFFDAAQVLEALGLERSAADVLDLGCGYGTFTVAAAGRTTGTVVALDIDRTMIDATMERARALGLENVVATQRDFVADGTGLAAESVDFVMLFNILHGERPLPLVEETFRVLRPGGRVAAVHWIHDPETPRGPPLAIRPRPEQFVRWFTQAGFRIDIPYVALPPYHCGVVGAR